MWSLIAMAPGFKPPALGGEIDRFCLYRFIVFNGATDFSGILWQVAAVQPSFRG